MLKDIYYLLPKLATYSNPISYLLTATASPAIVAEGSSTRIHGGNWQWWVTAVMNRSALCVGPRILPLFSFLSSIFSRFFPNTTIPSV